MKQSYAHDIFLAEEIGLSVARNIKIPSSSDVIVKTEETRPTTASIINHNLHDANKWYEIKLPREAITWQMTARGNNEINYSFSPREVLIKKGFTLERMEKDWKEFVKEVLKQKV